MSLTVAGCHMKWCGYRADITQWDNFPSTHLSDIESFVSLERPAKDQTDPLIENQLTDRSRINILDWEAIQFGWQCGADLGILGVEVDLEHRVTRFSNFNVHAADSRLAQ